MTDAIGAYISSLLYSNYSCSVTLVSNGSYVTFRSNDSCCYSNSKFRKTIQKRHIIYYITVKYFCKIAFIVSNINNTRRV